MAKKDYESRTEAMLMPIVEAKGFELVDVEWVKEGANWYLRAYIDKENGITVDDCEEVSRALSDLLDEEDFISENYILEVSSPGLDRPLKKEKDFARSIGKDVEVKLSEPLVGKTRGSFLISGSVRTSCRVKGCLSGRRTFMGSLYSR